MMRASMCVALAAGGVLAASAVAGPRPVAGHGRPMARALPGGGVDGPPTIELSNNLPGDGRLVINPDAYGAVTVWTWTANWDFYDPAGASATTNPTFASSVFLYSGGVDRLVLATPGHDLKTSYPETGLANSVTSALVGSDSDGDTVIDTANSTVAVAGGAGAFNLSIQVFQRVYKPAAGSSVARFQQRYTITNNGAAPAVLKVGKHIDADMLWDAQALDVAGSIASGGAINPYQREPGVDPTIPEAMGLISPTPGYVYYAGRSGFDPDGAGPDPAMAYGSDFQIWNAYGLPTSWGNYTAGIGYAPTVGELPDAVPVGGAAPNDSFMGLQWEVTIPVGGNRVFEFTTVYGARTFSAGTVACYPNCDHGTTAPCLNVGDFGCFLNEFAAGSSYANCDGSTSIPVLNVQDFGCFLNSFAAGCGTNC